MVKADAHVIVIGDLGGGWDLFASAIRHHLENVAMLVLLEQVTEEDVFYALRAGMTACRRRNIGAEALVQIVFQAAQGVCGITGRNISSAMPSRRMYALEQLAEEPTPGTAICQLSAREMEILVGVAEGCSNKEIGRRCGISDQTVKNHLTSVLRKLGVSYRTEAVVHALRHQWLKLDRLRVGSSAA